eukprot:scaffold932_cov207-Alexandrium_tamarense.AAC.32
MERKEEAWKSSRPTDVTEDERICACPQEQSIAILRTYCPVRDIIRGGFLEARLYCYVELRGLEFAQRGVPPRQYDVMSLPPSGRHRRPLPSQPPVKSDTMHQNVTISHFGRQRGRRRPRSASFMHRTIVLYLMLSSLTRDVHNSHPPRVTSAFGLAPLSRVGVHR